MKKMVYDLPLRVFHFLFGVSFLFAFAIGKWGDEDSPSYSFHMLLGLGIFLLIVFRVIWWVFGTQHSRLSSMPLGLKSVVDYFLSLFRKNSRLYAGHNPASSWLGVLMFGLAIGAIATGTMMALEFDSFKLKDIHEILVNLLFLLFLGHVAGVLFHTIKHKDPIALSMVTGEKKEVSDSESIKDSQRSVAMVLLIVFVVFGFYLVSHFNSEDRTLNLFGQKLTLGDVE